MFHRDNVLKIIIFYSLSETFYSETSYVMVFRKFRIILPNHFFTLKFFLLYQEKIPIVFIASDVKSTNSKLQAITWTLFNVSMPAPVFHFNSVKLEERLYHLRRLNKEIVRGKCSTVLYSQLPLCVTNIRNTRFS